jgi:hypothetical protein
MAKKLEHLDLAEAVADAKTLITGATVNAKLALEEALTPQIKSILYSKLAEDLEEDTEESMEEELTSEINFTDEDEDKEVDENYDEMDDMDDMDGMDEEVSLEDVLRELELDEEEPVEEETEESIEEKYNEEDEINEILSSLVDGDTLEEKVSTIKSSIADYLKFERKDKDEDDVVDEEIELDLFEEEDEDLELDELVAEYNRKKEEKMKKENLARVTALSRALDEAKKKAADMEGKLREMNLFNAKLLYANKLLKEHSLTKEDKDKVLSKLEKAKNVREAKFVYELINENYISNKQNIQESLGFASKSVSSTSKTETNILNESVADRFKKLANII